MALQVPDTLQTNVTAAKSGLFWISRASQLLFDSRNSFFAPGIARKWFHGGDKCQVRYSFRYKEKQLGQLCIYI